MSKLERRIEKLEETAGFSVSEAEIRRAKELQDRMREGRKRVAGAGLKMFPHPSGDEPSLESCIASLRCTDPTEGIMEGRRWAEQHYRPRQHVE